MRLPRAVVLLAALLVCLAPWRARAQQEDVQPESVAQIQDRLTAAGDDPAVEEPASELIRTLRAAKDAAQRAADSRAKAAEFKSKTENAPALLNQYADELNSPPPTVTASPPAGATLQEIQRLADQADGELAEAKSSLESTNQENPRRAERMSAIPEEIAKQQTEIDRLRRELATPTPADANPGQAEAQRVRLAAELDAAKSKVAELQAEAASYDGRRDLLVARQAMAKRRLTQAESAVAAWQKVLAERRAKEAKEATEQASQRDLDAAAKIGALAPIRDQILRLLDDLKGPSAAPQRIERATKDLSDTSQQLNSRRELAIDLHNRVASQGSVPYGSRLQKALQDLKDIDSYKRQWHYYLRQMTDAQVRLDELNDLSETSSDIGSRLAELMDAMGADAEAHKDLASRLLEQRRTLVRQVLQYYETYSETLDKLDAEYALYIGASERLQSFVEEHVFWVRSVPRDSVIPKRSEFAYDLQWLTDARAWRDASLAAASRVLPTVTPPGRSAGERAVWPLFVLPVGAALVMLLGVLASVRLGYHSRKPLPTSGLLQHMSMAGCLWKLALAFAAALPMPVALWVLSGWLGLTADALTTGEKAVTPIPLAVASGLSRGAYVWLGLGLLRELIRPGAVGASHFRWPDAGLAHFRRQLRWFTPVAIVAAIVIEAYNSRSNGEGTEVLGRLTLAAVLLLIALLQKRVFAPGRPLMAEYWKRNKGGLIARSSRLWYPLLVVVPVALSVATLAGYVYTALQIQRHLGDTFLFVLLVIVGQALVLRYLQLARRKIAMEAARARLAAQQEGDGEPKGRDSDASIDIDLNTINQQSRKVIQAVTAVVLVVGLYTVWNEVLPALKWFERLQVLPTIEYLEPRTDAAFQTTAEAAPSTAGEASSGGPGPGGELSPTPPGSPLAAMSASTGRGAEAQGGALLSEHLASVTVADIGLAILLLMLTVSASRNVPGLLEITLLPRLPINAAARYAVFTVARYIVIIIGLIAISRTLEIPWKSAQWLAAAFTFGLAFGLQEIFANFVSGLIILFEQPIRVGDTVTVGSVSGTVAKIRMRATTMVDWDNKELVIPNKTFITDQIINWTLSDPVCRVIVPVGIAYGSNTELARDLLLKAARESPHTLGEPTPKALFLGFGDNSLNFELRTFIDTIDNLIATKSDLHFRIDKAFREAGIEISFPQRDLHIRSIDDEVVRRVWGRGGTPEGPGPAS